MAGLLIGVDVIGLKAPLAELFMGLGAGSTLAGMYDPVSGGRLTGAPMDAGVWLTGLKEGFTGAAGAPRGLTGLTMVVPERGGLVIGLYDPVAESALPDGELPPGVLTGLDESVEPTTFTPEGVLPTGL